MVITYRNAICWSTIRCQHFKSIRWRMWHCRGLTIITLSSFPYPMKRPTSTPSSNHFNGRLEYLKDINKFVFRKCQKISDDMNWFCFPPQIWLGLGVSIICVIAALNFMQRALSYLIPENGDYRSQFRRRISPIDGNPSTNKTTNKGRRRVKKETAKQFLYVFGNLLSQGQMKV